MSDSPQKTAAVTPSPKSSPTKKEIDAATAALNHFAQGKRHLVVGDIPSAVNSLQEACRFLAEEYGETAPECGDAYFHYGRALLELARLESGVLGNALDGEDGSTEDEEEEEDDEGDGDGESQGGESQDEDGNKDEIESQEETEGEKTEEEEEVSNLQLSWEMLELAKVIFEKQQDNNPEMAEKVAQVYLKLGEVGLECENYAQGIEDLRKCLEIQEKVLKEDNRCLAETHYQLGVAHSYSDDFDKAVESLQAAVRVIELRISNLGKTKKEKEMWTEEQKVKDAAERPDPFYTEQGEIDELNQLLPEIKEKITDMEEMKKDTKEKLQKAAKEALTAQTIRGKISGFATDGLSQSGFDAPSSASSSAEAKPITHLVRKKRKPEDFAEGEVKKVKGENGEALNITNGTKKCVNGQPQSMEPAQNKESPSKSQNTEELKKKVAEEMNKKNDEIKDQPQVVT